MGFPPPQNKGGSPLYFILSQLNDLQSGVKKGAAPFFHRAPGTARSTPAPSARAFSSGRSKGYFFGPPPGSP